MQRYLLAAVAVAAIASPAAARDGSFYGGIEAGVVFPRDSDANVDVDYTTTNFPVITGGTVPANTPAGPADASFSDVVSLDAKTGYEIGFFGGYDFGMFRLEGEVDWKHANLDDLTIQGISEPYRMLTARSEYRLHLRADNAVSRLGPLAMELGCLEPEQLERVRAHLEQKRAAAELLTEAVTGAEVGLDDPARRPLSEWVRRDEAVGAVLDRLPKSAAAEEAMADAAYAPYLVRQQQELAARSRDRSVSIPTGFDLGRVPGLSTEMRERLQAAGPSNLDQAARVPGVTPAALAALHFALVRAAA